MDIEDLWLVVSAQLPREVVSEVNDRKLGTMSQRITACDEALAGMQTWPLWRDALSGWSRKQTDAAFVARTLAELDQKLCAWCMCDVTRPLLKYIPDSDRALARSAIVSAALALVQGLDSKPSKSFVADVASIAMRQKQDVSRHAMTSCANTASVILEKNVEDITDAARAVVTHAALACACDQDGRRELGVARTAAEMLRICQTIADSILTMPWEPFR